jgi:lipopolysaccharide transport system ATP-binding protein
MRKKEITRKLDEIIDFSGVERYIDTPVKRYSSGMYVRLAFAVAAYLESEILIVDEVLAVGDAEFQKKCLGKMGDISAKDGRTVLFVSHNLAAVKNLCNRGILLENGLVGYNGNVDTSLSSYLQANENTFKNYKVENGLFNLSNHNNKKTKNNGIISVELFCNRLRTNTLITGSKVEFKFKFKNSTIFREPVLGIVIKDEHDVAILGLNNKNTNDNIINNSQTGEITITFPIFRIIKAKTYTVDIYYGDDENNKDTIVDAFYFNVLAISNGKKQIQEHLNYFYDEEIKFN